MNDLERSQNILIVSALASVARYLFSEGQFSVRALLANMFLAAFLGWLGVLVAEWRDFSAGQAGVIVGILAWLGPTSLTEWCRRFMNTAAKTYLGKK